MEEQDAQNDPQIEEIYSLIENNKFDEAKDLLQEVLGQELSPQERGKILTDTTMTYVAIMNDINSKYLEMMDKRLRDIEEANGIIEKIDTKVNLAETREKIMNS